jgi:hypothetical protein
MARTSIAPPHSPAFNSPSRMASRRAVVVGLLLGYSWGIAANNVFSPRLVVTDASAEVLGRYQLDNQVSTAGKKVGNFESVFSGEYGFANGGDWRPDALKGTSANGGSLCLEHRGDTLNTDENLLVIHGAAAGPDTISLPVGVNATPLGGGTASTGTLNLNFSREGETQWFQLSQSSQGAKVSGSPSVK